MCPRAFVQLRRCSVPAQYRKQRYNRQEEYDMAAKTVDLRLTLTHEPIIYESPFSCKVLFIIECRSRALLMAACGCLHGSFHFPFRVRRFSDARRLRALALLPCGVFLQNCAGHVFHQGSAAGLISGLDSDGAVPHVAALVLRGQPGVYWRPENLQPPLRVQCRRLALRDDPANVAGLFWLFFDAHST